ncbi:MAG: energy transducer TonB [Hydrogenophaga sp.]|nr:energy transducer TonB [Hydrogenophaga sp.]
MDRRRLYIVTAVIGFHVLGLWALQSGLLRRAAELVIPVQIIAELIEAPQPEVVPVPPSPPVPPAPAPPRAVAAKTPRPAPPAAQPIAIAEPTPMANAPTGVTAPEPVPVTASAPAAEASVPAPPAPPAQPRVELPSSSADYLNNPRPPYPPLSKRLGEQGRVVVRVFIDASGSATQAEIRTSSGYDRLDQTALQTVLRWRYVPGKRNGVAEAMWFNVPISFVLE